MSKQPLNKIKLQMPENDWITIFKQESIKSELKKVKKVLNNDVLDGFKIVPNQEDIFRTFNITSFADTKVVIIGQDPYFKYEKGKPQATGLSFSVPNNIKIPSSLTNIYKNLIKFNHISDKPKHGDLTNWALQGCLMLNTSLTTVEGLKGRHIKDWTKITDEIISYISNNKSNVIFVLWGAPALTKLKLIDLTKHKVSISSHPSGLSNTKPLKQYNSFNDTDHFKFINDNLDKPIDWNP